ncbi:MAG: hypothetical protein AAFP04_05015 [Myxococcota bacterium]
MHRIVFTSLLIVPLAACGGNLIVDLEGGSDTPIAPGGGSGGDGGGSGGDGGGSGGDGGGSGGDGGGSGGDGGGDGGGSGGDGGGSGGGGSGGGGGLGGCLTTLCDNVCCPEGSACVNNTCTVFGQCNDTDLCGGVAPRCCPSERPVCVFGQFCQAECPSESDERCGGSGEVCCGGDLVCSASLTCTEDCAEGQALCGTGTPESFGTVCCDAGDQCVFDACVSPGRPCESFLDCDNGEYCELVLDADPENPNPNRGLCLPDEFPDDIPVCQAPPDDILLPAVEWRWLGVELRGTFAAGEIVDECEGPTDDDCYVYPCTDYNDGSINVDQGDTVACWNNIEAIPVVFDMDREPDNTGAFHPEVAIKAYRDGSFNSGNILVVLDGRDGSNRLVVFGESRGHLATADLDQDPQLEIVSLGNGIRAFDPFPATDVCAARDVASCESDAQCRLDDATCERDLATVWSNNNESDRLNRNFRAGAPAITDLNGDGDAEVVVSSIVLDGATGTKLVDCGSDGGGNNDDEQWYISVIADIDLDAVPEILTGNRSFSVDYNVDDDIWSCSEDWRARFANDATDDLGAGFPGVGNFVDNQSWPYAPAPDARCETLSGAACSGVCAQAGDTCVYNAELACGELADEVGCARYLACSWNGDSCVENTDFTDLYPVDRDYPEVVTTRNGRVFIVHGATGRVMPSPADGNTPLFFEMFNNRGGTPNIADFDGDGRVEVSFASTGCMAVFDPDCAVGSAEERLGEYSAAVEANCGDPDEWQHPLCEVCADDPQDPRCTECPAEPSAAQCVFLPDGCGQSPRASHPDLEGEVYGCTARTEPDLVRDMIGALWMRTSQDISSAATGTSVFDFQGDGKAEVLYGDECFFRVYNGENGNLIFERPNSHRTATEYPLVVDVDGDAQSEILVVSNSDQLARDRCGLYTVDGDVRQGAYFQPAGTYELYTPEYCSCGNFDVCAMLSETECPNSAGCAWNPDDTQCEPIDCAATYSTAAACDSDQACRYNESLSTCERSTIHPAVQCDLGDGCEFDETALTCEPVICDDFDSDENACTSVTGCEWRSGDCRESPRHPNQICDRGTWGISAIGDTRDQWVRTLPYWHHHSYHVTEVDRDGQAIADWGENTSNPELYNNYRQNVQGFVPLNAPDLQIFSFNASLAQCPNEVQLVARVVNRGRAGIAAGTPIEFYRAFAGQSPVLIDTVGLPFSILPGQGADVTAEYDLSEFGDAGFSMAFLVVANPAEGVDTVFECDGDNNSAAISSLDCFDGG